MKTAELEKSELESINNQEQHGNYYRTLAREGFTNIGIYPHFLPPVTYLNFQANTSYPLSFNLKLKKCHEFYYFGDGIIYLIISEPTCEN